MPTGFMTKQSCGPDHFPRVVGQWWMMWLDGNSTYTDAQKDQFVEAIEKHIRARQDDGSAFIGLMTNEWPMVDLNMLVAEIGLDAESCVWPQQLGMVVTPSAVMYMMGGPDGLPSVIATSRVAPPPPIPAG
jgi:hypothetical protein